MCFGLILRERNSTRPVRQALRSWWESSSLLITTRTGVSAHRLICNQCAGALPCPHRSFDRSQTHTGSAPCAVSRRDLRAMVCSPHRFNELGALGATYRAHAAPWRGCRGNPTQGMEGGRHCRPNPRGGHGYTGSSWAALYGPDTPGPISPTNPIQGKIWSTLYIYKTPVFREGHRITSHSQSYIEKQSRGSHSRIRRVDLLGPSSTVSSRRISLVVKFLIVILVIFHP